MMRLMFKVAGAFALALLALPGSASAACDCSHASLIGDSVTTQAGGGPVVTRTVSNNVELPGAGPVLGMAGPSPRLNINFTANTIRVDFTQAATYGTNYALNFANLNPVAPAGCTGTPKIVGINVQTNKPNAGFVTTGATYGPNNVRVPFGPPSGNIDWNKGEYFLVTLRYACDEVTPPPTGSNACCPPWNSTALGNSLYYSGSGSISAPYSLNFTPSAVLNTQMNAYVAYVHAMVPAVTSMTVSFRIFNGGTGATSVPGALLATSPNATWHATTAPMGFNLGYSPMVVNNWYRIKTTIALNNGQQFFGRECMESWIDFRVQYSQSLMAPGGQGSPLKMQMRFPSGQMIESPINASDEQRPMREGAKGRN